MKFLKIWNWILNLKLPDGACVALQINPPCALCWICVGFFFMILTFILAMYSQMVLTIIMFVIAMISYIIGLIQNENER